MARLERADKEDGQLREGWRPHHNAGHLSIVLGRLASVPTTGFRAKTTKRRVVYRMGTEKAKLHVYYIVDAAKSVVTVLHVW